jgi:hypothetical protein
MKEEKAINQLLSLIDDRKSFITKDGDIESYLVLKARAEKEFRGEHSETT